MRGRGQGLGVLKHYNGSLVEDGGRMDAKLVYILSVISGQWKR